MTKPESTEQNVDNDIEEIIDQIAREKPWHGPIYGFVYFLRRWMVFLFAMHFCVFTSQPWFITVPLCVLTFLSDWFIAPRYATDLRLGDREFVRKVCIDHVIEGPLSPKVRKIIKKVAVVPFCIGGFYITFAFIYIWWKLDFLSRDFERSGIIFAYPYIAYSILFALFFLCLFCLAFYSYAYPFMPFPTIKKKENNVLELFDYKSYVFNYVETRSLHAVGIIVFISLSSIFYLNIIDFSKYEKIYIAYSISLAANITVMSLCCLNRVYWKFDDIACYYDKIRKKTGE